MSNNNPLADLKPVNPSLRFKNENGEAFPNWEQRKLGEIASIIGGGTPSTSNPKYWNGEIDWYAPAEIGNQIYLTGSQKKITQEGLKNSSAKILPVGTVLFTSRAGIGKSGILASPGATNQGFQSICPNEKMLDSYFIYSRTLELKRYAEKVGAGSTFTEVSGKQMAAMPLLIPSLEEQKKIGNFFQNLDNLITLHQDKLSDLKSAKETLLTQMFPMQDEDKPQLRFPGFDSPWEQRKVGELGTVLNGKTPSTNIPDYYSKDGMLWVTPSDIANKENIINNTIYKTSKCLSPKGQKIGKIAPEGSILVTCMLTSIGKNVLLPYAGSFNQQINALIPNREENDPYFLLTQSFIWSDKMKKSSVPGSKQLINKTDFSNITTFIPKLEEQKKIGHLFLNLDNLITLHQGKLEILQKAKQSFLTQMFM